MSAYVVADNIVSPLGFTTAENFEQLKAMKTGIKFFEHSELWHEPLFAAKIENASIEEHFQKLNCKENYTRLEKLLILSITDALSKSTSIDTTDQRTLIILSTTKGNIDLLDKLNEANFDKKRIYLWETANIIARYFKNPNQPLVISNACISGVLALVIAKRLLDDKQYENVIVCGADILTHFVVSGFQSFKAVSSQIAKPYDVDRDGISLGEAAGTIILTNNEIIIDNNESMNDTKSEKRSQKSKIILKGGASSNDANHISGPSRTGDGLLLAIENTLNEAKIKASEVDFISGHGTATLFNDEMESLAITDAGLPDVPMNSLKSFFGHTLGAAGIIESVVALESMRQQILIGTYNYNNSGTSKPVNIIRTTEKKQINTFLKTAAGFGGCNAAVVFTGNI